MTLNPKGCIIITCWGSMTLFFDLQKLETYSSKSNRSLKYCLYCLYKNIPSRTVPNPKSLIGKSWILHPDNVLDDKSTDVLYTNQYIRLAARRSYTLYKLYGIKYLDLSNYPEIDISQINHNPLFEIKQNKIYFKYEE